MSKIVRICAGALLGSALLGAAPAGAQQGQASQAGQAAQQGAPAKPLATGACRVKEQAGGRTCTGDVPEAACAAIAREGKGTFTWTREECP